MDDETCFFGMILETRKDYKQRVTRPFRLTMACLDLKHSDDKLPVQVMVSFNNNATKYLLCTLHKTTTWQVPLNINIEKGSFVTFSSNGEGFVHLTGNYKSNLSKLLEIRSGEDEIAKHTKLLSNSNENQNDNKDKFDDDTGSSDSEMSTIYDDDDKLSSSSSSVDNSVKIKDIGQDNINKMIRSSGMKMIQLTHSGGEIAKLGKNATIYYLARMQLGSHRPVIEKCLKGIGFRFKIGSGMVLRGLDAGVLGMRVGEKRRLIIPPKMGFGAKGCLPDVPPFAILVYDVELLKLD